MPVRKSYQAEFKAKAARRKKNVREILTIPQNHTEKIRLSVIITFCNQLQFVEECLNSVLMQLCDFPFEILITVDGEDDGTMSVLKKFSEKYPFIKFWKVNSDKRLLTLSRVSMNRLFLLEKSRGDYFCVLDGDDFYIDSRHFANAVFFLDRHEDCIAYSGEMKWFNQNTKSFFQHKEGNSYTYNFEEYFQHYVYIHCSCFIYRNIFQKNHIIFPNRLFFDDCFIRLFMLMQGNYHASGKFCFAYRCNCGSQFYDKPILTKTVLQMAIYLKLYQLTTKKHYLAFLAGESHKILDDGTFIFDEDVRQQILYQNLPIARDFVRYAEFSDEEKKKFLKRMRNVISLWHGRFTLYRNGCLPEEKIS